MMRRVQEGDARGAPPFRVLGDTGSHVYVGHSPLASLAPEPYKISTSSSTSNRARRRSSFVIIAETRPATPTSRSPSPSLATGRASPFRGRGFKGPPPRAQSRPQTPEAKETRRGSRLDRRMSTSQQNSPKRSLIPQPARRRSVSLSKTETGRASPKYGRRSTSKNHLEVNHLAASRRGSLKVPGLSPIMGTPTKPPERRFAQNSLAKKSSPVKSMRKNSTVLPPKGAVRQNQALKTKPPSKPTKIQTQDQPTSPSKIPVKKNSVPDLKGGQILRQNSRRGSLAKLSVPKPGEKVERSTGAKPDQKERKIESKSTSGNKSESSGQTQSTSKKTDSKTQQSTSSKKNGDDVVEGKEPEAKLDEPSLLDLLKQSSGASGTSSVVNTTTVTAVQPLQIDAVSLFDSEANKTGEKEVEVKRRHPDSGRRSGMARPTGINVPSSNSDSYSSPQQEDTTDTKVSDGVTSDGTNRHPKNGNETQGSAKSSVPSARSSATNGERQKSSGQTSGLVSAAGKTVGYEIVNEMANSDLNSQSTNTVNGIESVGGGQHRKNIDVNQRDSPITDLSKKHSDGQSVSMKGSGGSEEGHLTAKSSAHSVNVNDSIVTPVNKVVSVSDGMNISSGVVSSVKRLQDDQHVMGSAVSLKSRAGLSTGSTDTGVSVNTVRGVSSAREKRGMHMVKQPQGIETLSGNIVHLEQNGEPVVPGARPSDHYGEDQDPHQASSSVDPEKSRWKRIFDRCCGCCKCNCNCCSHGRTMRCLACRRGLKPQMNQPQTMIHETPKGPSGCLSKLKLSSSRCCRLPNWKGCARGSRVAPSEAEGCCPPERRCGAVFRRLCSRCICKRQDGPPQIRNIQAKQSLTSIAAPVLPEEPKSKLPEVLVEHNAPMRGAIPCLPIPLAWFCLVWNVLLPGTGTVWSGLFNLCVGQPRFSAVATPRARVGAFFVNTVVGVGQMFTVLFCLVGWGWSIWWGVTMVRLARKYKRFRDSEAATNDVEARGGAGDPSTAPPGVPSQLRGHERAR